MCGSLERKAQRGRKADKSRADKPKAWLQRSLTVCAGNLCGRLRLDQRIQSCRVVYKDLSSNCHAIGAQVRRLS